MNPTNPINPANLKNPTTSKNPSSQRRPSLPKQTHWAPPIRKDATIKKKKKKEPFSYKYVRRKAESFWSNYWEVIFTIVLAIIFSLFILPRFFR